MINSFITLGNPIWVEMYPSPPLPESTPTKHYQMGLVNHMPSGEPWVIEHQKCVTSYINPSFWHRDFKNSLITTPKHIDLGFITGESEQYIEIWSTFERPLTLMGLQAFNAQGLALTGAQAGAVLAPYGGHWNYQLHVSLNVDFEVDARFDWQFDAISTALKVTGSRIVLWHYRPLYPVGQHWEWSNAIIDTYSGEQRLCNAQYPVQRFTYQHGEENLSGGQALTRFAGNGRFPIALPHWIDAVDKVNASKGDTLVRCSTVERGFFAGGYVLIYQSPTHFEVHKIEKVTAESITLSKPLSIAFTNATVTPASYCVSKEGLQTRRSGRYQGLKIQFTDIARPQFAGADWKAFAWLDHYQELPVLIERTGKQSGVSDEVRFNIREKTTPNGQIHFLAIQDFGRRSTQVELTAIGRTRIHQLKQFIWHLKGSLNTVWWVSFHNEIRLAATCSRNRLVIKPLGLGSYINGVELALTWRDGKEYVHATSDGIDSNGNEILLLNTVNTAAANMGDLVSGHVMVRMRATSDEQTMTYTKEQLTVSLNLTEVPHGSD